MRTTVPCPMCSCSLTFIATSPTLACPFCRATIKFPRGKYPVGKKVRCGRCRGVFSAESPPPAVRVYASALEACPTCGVMLAIRKNLPPGKKVRCFQCRTKFLPRRSETNPAAYSPPHLARAPVSEPAAPIAAAAATRNGVDKPEIDPPAPLPTATSRNSVDKPVAAPAVLPAAAALRNGFDKPAAAPPKSAPALDGTAGKRPASQTRLGRRASRSSITHLASGSADEAPTTTDAAPAKMARVNDDEVDFFNQEQTVGRAPVENAPSPPEDGSDPFAAPPAVDLPKTIRVSLSRQLAAPREPAEKILAKEKPNPIAPALTPLETLASPTESAAAPLLAREKPEPAKPTDRRAPDRRNAGGLDRKAARAAEMPDPVAKPAEPPVVHENPTDSDALSPEPREEAPATAAPLSIRSAAELDAAAALLGDAPQSDVVVLDDENPGAAEVVAVQPAASTTQAPPIQPPARRPAAATGGGLEIDGKKMLAYAGSGLAVLLVGAGLYFLLFASGLGKQKVYPTEVEVLFQGKPAAGARVTLFPVAKTRHRFFPSGKVGDDGILRLTTYAPDDGAPAGRYKVAIVRGLIEMDEYAELSKKHTPDEIKQIAEERAQDPLYSKYANQRDSGVTLEIPPPSGRLKIELD